MPHLASATSMTLLKKSSTFLSSCKCWDDIAFSPIGFLHAVEMTFFPLTDLLCLECLF